VATKIYQELDSMASSSLKIMQKTASYKQDYTIQERRFITYIINARQRKHKTNTPAINRARLLGQLKYFSKAIQGQIANAEQLMRMSVNDLPYTCYHEIEKNLTLMNDVLKRKLLPAIEDALDLTSKKRKNSISL